MCSFVSGRNSAFSTGQLLQQTYMTWAPRRTRNVPLQLLLLIQKTCKHCNLTWHYSLLNLKPLRRDNTIEVYTLLQEQLAQDERSCEYLHCQRTCTAKKKKVSAFPKKHIWKKNLVTLAWGWVDYEANRTVQKKSRIILPKPN